MPVAVRAKAEFQLLPSELVVVIWESYKLEKQPSFVHALMDTVSLCLPPTTQQQGRSCSVDAPSAVARQSRGLDRPESSVRCCCAGGSAGESAGVNAAAGNTAVDCTSGSHPVRCRGGTLLEQLLPCSTCRSPRLHPTEVPAGAPCTAQGNKLSTIPFIQYLQLSHREVGVISPQCFVVSFLSFF